MRTIYIDSNFRCHVNNYDGTLTPVETYLFDGKCDAFIEGYRFVPEGETWVRHDGKTFDGEMIAPWRDYSKLDAAQREYEKELIAIYEQSLTTMGVVL